MFFDCCSQGGNSTKTVFQRFTQFPQLVDNFFDLSPDVSSPFSLVHRIVGGTTLLINDFVTLHAHKLGQERLQLGGSFGFASIKCSFSWFTRSDLHLCRPERDVPLLTSTTSRSAETDFPFRCCSDGDTQYKSLFIKRAYQH